MNESLETVREIAAEADINYDVQCALQGITNWRSQLNHNLPAWSPIFDGYTAACTQLNSCPFEPLTYEKLDIPEGINFLGRKLLELVNSSLDRYGDSQVDFTSKETQFEDACDFAEPHYLKSLGHLSKGFLLAPSNDNNVFLNEDMEPVIFQKGSGCESAINFSEIGINGVVHAPGTLLSIVQKPDAKMVDQFDLTNVFTLDAIRQVQPIRLSLFAIPRTERFDTVFSTRIQKMMASEVFDKKSGQLRLIKLLQISELGIHLENQLAEPVLA